ncbi:MAG: radical SAM protein [Candidatus Aenigmatarchaeota archaeon]
MMNKEKILSFNINTNCNLRCRMCGIPNRKWEEMTTEQVKKMLDELHGLGFGTIFMAGGEPLLRKDIYEIIAYGNELNIDMVLITNGTLISEQVAQKLRESGVYSVSVSLDGPMEVHDYFRGKGVYDRTVNGIKNLRKYGVRTGMAMTIMKPNYMHMCDIVELAHELGVESLIFQPYCQYPGVSNSMTEKLSLDSNDFAKFRKEFFKTIHLIRKYRMYTAPMEFMMKIPEYFENSLKVEPVCDCPALYKSMVIEADGNIYPCFSLEEHKLGNIKEDSLLNIWDSEKHNEVRKLSKEGRCPGCVLTCYNYIYRNTMQAENTKTLKLGNVCNNNCKFCKYIERKGIINKSTKEIMEELEDTSKNDLNTNIVLTGGEPTIREDIFDILEYAQNLGLYEIHMKTNGRMLSYKDYAEKMSDFCNAFQIHLFGHTAETHDCITGVDGSFEQTLQGIRNLVELDKRVFVNIIINRMNYKFLKETIGLLMRLGINEVIFTYPEPFEYENKNFYGMIPHTLRAARFIEDAMIFARQNRIRITSGTKSFSSRRPLDLDLDPESAELRYQLKVPGGKDVSVIIPTHNRKKLLKNCLISLFNQMYSKDKYEIIVVDDGSNDGTEEMIKSLDIPCNLKYYYWPRAVDFKRDSPRNRAGPARNIGISNASGEVILFIDSDIIASSNLIEEHMRTHRECDDCVTIGYRIELFEDVGEITKAVEKK